MVQLGVVHITVIGETDNCFVTINAHCAAPILWQHNLGQQTYIKKAAYRYLNSVNLLPENLRPAPVWKVKSWTGNNLVAEWLQPVLHDCMVTTILQVQSVKFCYIVHCLSLTFFVYRRQKIPLKIIFKKGKHERAGIKRCKTEKKKNPLYVCAAVAALSFTQMWEAGNNSTKNEWERIIRRINGKVELYSSWSYPLLPLRASSFNGIFSSHCTF